VSGISPNISRPEEVLEAVRTVCGSLEAPPKGVRVLLPVGTARIVLLKGERSVDPPSLVRFRLARSLPYPEDEAVVDAVRLPGGRFLGAAIRRGVVESYESLLARAGVGQERIDLTPIAAHLGLETRSPKAGSCSVVLGDEALSWSVRGREGMLAFRTRLRTGGGGEARWLADELERTRLRADKDLVLRRIRVVGPGATGLIGDLLRLGLPAEPGWGPPGVAVPGEPNEIPWLGAAVA
jgi:hypothetical protein